MVGVGSKGAVEGEADDGGPGLGGDGRTFVPFIIGCCEKREPSIPIGAPTFGISILHQPYPILPVITLRPRPLHERTVGSNNGTSDGLYLKPACNAPWN